MENVSECLYLITYRTSFGSHNFNQVFGSDLHKVQDKIWSILPTSTEFHLVDSHHDFFTSLLGWCFHVGIQYSLFIVCSIRSSSPTVWPQFHQSTTHFPSSTLLGVKVLFGKLQLHSDGIFWKARASSMVSYYGHPAYSLNRDVN